MRLSLRAVLFALVGLVAIGCLVTSGALSTVSKSTIGERPSTSGFCNSKGVSMVIDYGTKSDKPPIIACGLSFEGSGWELFFATKQEVEGTVEYPTGFVCRINDFPSVADQPCTSTPSSTQGSWAYFYATSQLGDHWMFSAAGAAMRKPSCGDVDAWVFISPGENSHEPSTPPKTFKCKN